MLNQYMTHHGQQDQEALLYVVQPVTKHNVLPTDLEQSRQDFKRPGLGGEGPFPGTDGVLGTMPRKRVMFSVGQKQLLYV